ncbi:hypothetical protein [Pseudomonas asplenii]|uniref:hypothetical protein n=1 Tax=Pseudomonas asplenii TaxID=53407 RepID=UPI000382A8B6|nr:hypothetical protein [Pseudomonas fuscovaginae]
MSLYEIVFSGELLPGASVEQVRSNLARLFQADTQRIELLFSGRRLVLKNQLDAAAAEKYRATLERAGARVEVLAMPPQEVAVDTAAEPASRARVVPRDVCMAAFSSVDAPDYAIAEVGGDLQDPRPAAVAPVFDLSALSMAPLGSDMGQIPGPAAPAAPDTSHLKLC